MKNFPNAFVIILNTIIFSWVLTYIIPTGTFDRISDESTGVTQVINNSYHRIEANKLSMFDLFLAIPRRISDRIETILLILFTGGCFYVIEKTGALTESLDKLVYLLKGREVLSLIILSTVFLIGGITIGLQEEIIAMTPILLAFGRSLGYSKFTIILMSYGSAVLGSSFSPSNPFAVIIAQREAQLPLMSGTNFRLIVLAIAFLLWIIYLIRYAQKNRIEREVNPEQNTKITTRSFIIVSMLVLTFAIVSYGLLQLEWGFNEITASFFVCGILAGLIGRMSFNKTCETYVDGFKEMIFAAILLGLANSISLILREGMIIDTIVQALFNPLQYLPPTLSTVIMMVSQTILHFPMPSYSGQAVLTMPILVPLSDLIGISRQVCVLAYQYGAVMMDMLVPTNGALMAILAISGTPYNKWFQFAWKPTSMILIFASIVLVIAVLIGY
jgi:uncharacterized ion transporter superfamily protein YfcC